jgi:Carboxylesterase family
MHQFPKFQKNFFLIFFIFYRTAALQSLPRSRYFQLRRMQLLLANQSEDCLYLNVYAPPEGRATPTLKKKTNFR